LDTFAPHGTPREEDGEVGDKLVSYQQARVASSVGLIITEDISTHVIFDNLNRFIIASDPRVIPGDKKLAQRCHHFGTLIFGQLFHAGVSIKSFPEGSRRIVFARSSTPQQRYGSTPLPAFNDLIWEWIDAYGCSVRNCAEGELDDT
tara:strand:- start:365 stop:805 length:441 start_codon:yes stop_codon:yes gene_type:complete